MTSEYSKIKTEDLYTRDSQIKLIVLLKNEACTKYNNPVIICEPDLSTRILNSLSITDIFTQPESLFWHPMCYILSSTDTVYNDIFNTNLAAYARVANECCYKLNLAHVAKHTGSQFECININGIILYIAAKLNGKLESISREMANSLSFKNMSELIFHISTLMLNNKNYRVLQKSPQNLDDNELAYRFISIGIIDDEYYFFQFQEDGSIKFICCNFVYNIPTRLISDPIIQSLMNRIQLTVLKLPLDTTSALSKFTSKLNNKYHELKDRMYSSIVKYYENIVRSDRARNFSNWTSNKIQHIRRYLYITNIRIERMLDTYDREYRRQQLRPNPDLRYAWRQAIEAFRR